MKAVRRKGARAAGAQAPPTAIVYANDLMAIAGLRVAEHVYPSLTTIRQDPVAAGAAAAKLLLQRLRGEEVSTPVLPEPVLVVRDSVGAAPG